jgi:hypothetical protein
MIVVVDHGAAARSDLRVTVGQRGPDQTDMCGVSRVDMLLQGFRNGRQGLLPFAGYAVHR